MAGTPPKKGPVIEVGTSAAAKKAHKNPAIVAFPNPLVPPKKGPALTSIHPLSTFTDDSGIPLEDDLQGPGPALQQNPPPNKPVGWGNHFNPGLMSSTNDNPLTRDKSTGIHANASKPAIVPLGTTAAAPAPEFNLDLDDDPTPDETVAAVTSDPIHNTDDSNLTKPSPINLELDIDDDCIIRLYKLRQQGGTGKLQEAVLNTKKKLDPEVFKKFSDKITQNVLKQIEQTPREPKNKEHYTDKQFNEIFHPASARLHQDVQTTPNADTLIISFKDKTDPSQVQQVTTTLDEKNNKFMLNASDNGDQSLVVVIELALKIAKTIYPAKATFIIYPPTNMTDLTQQAKLATMATFVGLKPVFQPNPKIPNNDERNQQFVEFKKAFQTQFGTDDPSRLQNNRLLTPKNPELLNNLTPKSEYKHSSNSHNK